MVGHLNKMKKSIIFKFVGKTPPYSLVIRKFSRKSTLNFLTDTVGIKYASTIFHKNRMSSIF